MTDSQIKVAIEFGFSNAHISLALQRFTFQNAGELVDYLSEDSLYWEVESCLSVDELNRQMEKELTLREEKVPGASGETFSVPMEYELSDSSSLYKETISLHYQSMCLRCKDRKRQILSLPCCHIALCLICSNSTKHCPMRDCNETIKETLTVHW